MIKFWFWTSKVVLVMKRLEEKKGNAIFSYKSSLFDIWRYLNTTLLTCKSQNTIRLCQVLIRDIFRRFNITKNWHFRYHITRLQNLHGHNLSTPWGRGKVCIHPTPICYVCMGYTGLFDLVLLLPTCKNHNTIRLTLLKKVEMSFGVKRRLTKKWNFDI